MTIEQAEDIIDTLIALGDKMFKQMDYGYKDEAEAAEAWAQYVDMIEEK